MIHSRAALRQSTASSRKQNLNGDESTGNHTTRLIWEDYRKLLNLDQKKVLYEFKVDTASAQFELLQHL